MGQRVAGPRRRSKPTPVSRERRRAQQRAVRQRLGDAIAGVIRAAIEAALEAEVTALMGRARYARRAAAHAERGQASASTRALAATFSVNNNDSRYRARPIPTPIKAAKNAKLGRISRSAS